MDFDNIRDALEFLLGFNESDNKLVTREGDSQEDLNDKPWRPMTAREVADTNYEVAVNIADQLGMSDLYLGKIKKQAKVSEGQLTKLDEKKIDSTLKTLKSLDGRLDKIQEFVDQSKKDLKK